ncbi:hypothetical protein SUGI_0888670 [Cryptomeria japonica]|nr:hypothetical protein SUGI_0888670 [Cryptomeria japonica]
MAMLKPLNPSQKKKQVDITFFIYTRATGTVREFETKDCIAKKSFPEIKLTHAHLKQTAYARQGFAEKALALFRLMQDARFRPDQHTFSTILVACAKLRDLEEDEDVRYEAKFENLC